MDFLSKAKRSALMATIRSRQNKSTELALVKTFRLHRITGWRRHHPLPGRPDFVFRRQHLALFVDGCFWHGCPKHCNTPASNRDFWEKKLAANKARDRRVNRQLRKLGWCVHRIWEHDLRSRPSMVVRRVLKALCSGS